MTLLFCICFGTQNVPAEIFEEINQEINQSKANSKADSVSNEKGNISGKGTIKYIDLEGGFFAIIGDNKGHYDPMNLSNEFQVDGLRVSFQVKKRNDVMSIRMWGTIVEIIKIEITQLKKVLK